MLTGIKKWLTTICVTILTITCINIGFEHVTSALESTNRNELYAPNQYNVGVNNSEGYVKVYENNNFEYYYSNSKTILQIVNKKSGFVWSTGANTNKLENLKGNCSNVTKYSNEYYACSVDIGPTRNGKDSFESYASINGLLYFSLLNYTNNSKINPTSGNVWAMGMSQDNVTTTVGFYGHNQYANEWMFKMSYIVTPTAKPNKDNNKPSETPSEDVSVSENTESTSSSISEEVVEETTSAVELYINMRFTFTESGFDLNIYDEDIYGPSKQYVEAIYPVPLLGQSGGKIFRCKIDNADENGRGNCNFDFGKDDENLIVDNPNTNLDGYIFVPDGSGALIRFDNVKYYSSSSSGVYFDMYGDPYRSYFSDKEFQKFNEVYENDYVPTKQISMPVWGVSYGNKQDAFVAYVKEGSEYFGLLYNGRSLANEYASIRPRFEKNRQYVYNFANNPTPPTYTLNEKEINTYYNYDIKVAYNFLQGDGSDGEHPANYVGMALTYRDYLQRNGLVKNNVELKTGPKVDFLMSDSKEGIFGYSDVNVTSTDDIMAILTELKDDGITDITSTLYGWQEGGVSKALPNKVKWNKKAGGKKGIKDVVEMSAKYGYDIDFYQQYGMLNEAQYSSFGAYVVKTLCRDYGTYILSDNNKPMTWWYYTNADVAGEWLNKQAKELAKLGDNVGITTGGISTSLIPDYSKKLSYKAAANSIYHSTKEASSKLTLSGDTPNSYLWKNYEKFTNVSVYNSQYMCETDSVPFMEIVFGGLVNLYAEYANFSFYDKQSQLKMIDYNLNPSFIVSATENTDIMYTNSRDWFSTAYDKYHSIINEICDTVVPVLKLTQGKTIVDREVIELADKSLGLYVNTYATYNNGQIGNDKTIIAINYFKNDMTFNYNGESYSIPAESAIELK